MFSSLVSIYSALPCSLCKNQKQVKKAENPCTIMQIKQEREREREKVLNVPLNSHEIQSQSCHVQLKMNTGIFTSSSADSFREASILTSWTLSDFRLLACQITCHIVQIGKGQVASSLEGDSPLHPFRARVHQSVPANRIHNCLWLDLLTHWIVWNIST